MWSFENFALVSAAFVLGGFVKGAIGLGLPVVVLAFMAAPFGLGKAMAIMLAPCIATNIWQALAGPAFGQILRRLWTFLLAASIGIWFGVGVLVASPKNLLLGLLGVALCLYSLISLMRPQIESPGWREPYISPVAGGLGGVMFGMTGTFIVPGILYLQALGLRRDALVQAMGITFVVISAALAVSFFQRNLLGGDMAMISIYALLPTVAGMFLGQRFRHRISEAQFRRMFFTALFIVGLYLLGGAIF